MLVFLFFLPFTLGNTEKIKITFETNKSDCILLNPNQEIFLASSACYSIPFNSMEFKVSYPATVPSLFTLVYSDALYIARNYSGVMVPGYSLDLNPSFIILLDPLFYVIPYSAVSLAIPLIFAIGFAVVGYEIVFIKII